MNTLEKAKQSLYKLRIDGKNWDRWKQLYYIVEELKKEIEERKEFIEVYAKAFKEQREEKEEI